MLGDIDMILRGTFFYYVEKRRDTTNRVSTKNRPIPKTLPVISSPFRQKESRGSISNPSPFEKIRKEKLRGGAALPSPKLVD